MYLLKLKPGILLTFLALSFVSYGQTNGLEQGVGNLGKMISGKALRITFDSSTKIEGSEYLDEKWRLGEITTLENKKIVLKSRFNAYTQELEVLQNNKPLALSHSIVENVKLNGKKFKPIRDENANIIFAEELVEGPVSVFKKYTAYIKESNFKPGIQTIKPNDKIVIKKSLLYTLADTEDFLIFNKKKKDILAIINKDSKTLDFIKKNKLSYKKETDIIKIFNFYNKKS